jgi:tetratricopeptide (TPR) repeat protein
MAIRIGVLLLSSAGFLATLLLAVADYWIRTGDEPALRRAIRWTPWNPQPYLLLTALDAANEERYLRRAAELAPHDAPIKIRLALALEMHGRLSEAEALLLTAAQDDQTLRPSWSLANFYFRRQRWAEFWEYARRGAAIKHADLSSLYDLCFRVRPEPDWVMRALEVKLPDPARQLLEASVRNGLAAQSLGVAALAAQGPSEKQRVALQAAMKQAVEAGTTPGGSLEPAIGYWNLLEQQSRQRLGVIGARGIVNGEFRGELAGNGFDWRLIRVDGVEARRGHGILLRLTGRQPHEFSLLRQLTPLRAGRHYRLHFRYRTDWNDMGSPARWRVDGVEGPPLLSNSRAGDKSWQEGTMEFTSKRDWAEVDLGVKREPGTVRSKGELEISRVWSEEVSGAGALTRSN